MNWPIPASTAKPQRSPHQRTFPFEEAKVRYLYFDKGYTVKEIADRLNVSKSLVLAAMNDWQIARRRRRQASRAATIGFRVIPTAYQRLSRKEFAIDGGSRTPQFCNVDQIKVSGWRRPSCASAVQPAELDKGWLNYIVDPLSSTQDWPIIRASDTAETAKRLTVAWLPHRHSYGAAHSSL